MRKLNILKVIILMLGMTMTTACSKDDGISGDENPPANNTTATSEVKSVTLNEFVFDDPYYQNISTWGAFIHDDFSRRYALCLFAGSVAIFAQQRIGGSWQYTGTSQSSGCAILDIGEVSNIHDISTRYNSGGIAFKDYTHNYGTHLPFYPKHGYAACFTTGDGELKYLRIFAKGYTLDKDGALASITLQYQLY